MLPFHGDVVVWGEVDRLRFHGVMPLKELPHPQLGSLRINFRIRKAGWVLSLIPKFPAFRSA